MTLKLTNDLKLYCKSMGKVFKVTYIAKSDDEANEYMANHKDEGVIAEGNGLIFIASFYSITVPSNLLPD